MDNYFQQTPFPQQPQQINTPPRPMPEAPKTFSWLKWVLIIAVVALFSSVTTHLFLQSQKIQQPRQAPSVITNQEIIPVSVNNKELFEWYSVEYPNNFFITRRDYRTFGVAENRWKGETGHIPEATIQMYTNVIPDGMSLKDWINGVGDYTPPVDQGIPKSCKEFLSSLRQKVKYGDLFNIEYLKGDNCIYFGVSDVKETTIAGLPTIEFNTQAVSSRGTHTMAAYKNQSGVILLFDIYYTITGMSDEKDRTVEAYKSFLGTFKIREK